MTFKILIDRMANGPDSVGRLPDGRAALVYGGVPGDLVEIEINKEHARYVEATVSHVVESSPHRREAPCLHARSLECGGCPWQHIDELEQRRQKQETVEREVARIAPNASVKPILFPAPNLGYRRRAKLGHNGRKLGYRTRGVQRIFDVQECPVLDSRLQNELSAIRDAVEDWPSGNVDILVKEDGEVIVGGPARSFAQASAPVEAALIELVLEAIPSNASHVIELFCGSGTFTLPLAKRGHRISAWELDKHAVRTLQLSAPDIQTHRADLMRGKLDFGTADVVLLDPPRKGAAACLESIANTGCERICYVSCNVMTLCRDLATLETLGYDLSWVQPVDAFPQTHHIECVALMNKRTVS